MKLLPMKYYVYVFFIILLGSCRTEGEKQPSLFEKVTGSGIDFTNKVIDSKLENSFLFRNFYNGGGVAIGDINNDSLPDVFFTSNSGANKLYLNKGDFQFEDITEKAGIIRDEKWNTGVTFADVNGDGWLDIYVCTSGHMGTGIRLNKLYINNRNQTFTESAEAYGLNISGYTTQVSFFDYDLDGDLDCFLINNSPIPINQLHFSNRRDVPDSVWKIPEFLQGGGDHLYRNDNNHFVEVTREAGIHGGLISFGLGVSVSDINNDGYQDVFVSNDSYERDYLYINQKDGTFKDELEEMVQHTSFSSMGSDIADINNDGNLDFFTTDMLAMDDYRLKTIGSFDNISLFNSKLKAGFYFQYTKNCLQLNNGNGKFIDIARYAGVAATDWSWGALMFDMDNDGWNDLLVCNGVYHDLTNLDFMDFFANEVIQRMVVSGQKDDIDKVLKEIPQTALTNKVYRNDKNLRFTDIGSSWGLGDPSFSNGAAYGDLDNDGDLDLIINNENQPSFIYKNNSRELNKNNYLGISLKGIGKNPFAVGSKVQLFVGDQIMLRELMPSRGFQSSVDYKLVFGLGTVTHIDSMIVTWPDRTTKKFISPQINRTQVVVQDETAALAMQSAKQAEPMFSLMKTVFDKHQEDEHVDFYIERGIPRILSREGPKTATADINKDGLADIYIGGTPGHPGQLYLQKPRGQFLKKEEKSLLSFNQFEDGAVLFFDADKDDDMDLLICPGGNIQKVNSPLLQLRLLMNDGKGNFSSDTTAFTNTGMNISVAIADDINKDGYPDLFIGGRNFPGEYGVNPQSFIFINDRKGRFTEIAQALNPEIAFAGMITGATWTDIVGDAGKELIIVGEWMTPRVFTYKSDRFVEVNTNLNISGWWQTMITADLNGDGRQDLVLGNVGENFYLEPTAAAPVKLWVNDFDNNDNTNKVVTYTIKGKDMPVFLKNDLQEQLPSIKTKNLKHKEYAERSIQELFAPDIMSKALVKVFDYSRSCVAINEGNGKFRIEPLPVMSQLSCINSILATDVNNDGKIDLVTGGNQFGFLPQFEKLDANFGEVLINDGQGRFTWQPAATTGLNVRGEVKDIVEFNNKKNRYFLFLQNNDFPVLYQLDIRKSNDNQ